jgi:hypothetical protein
MRALLVFGLLLVAAPVFAQKFEYGKYDEVKEVSAVEWKATAEAGMIFTTGNSEATTASGGVKASRKTGGNKLSLEASGAYAKSSLWILADRNGNGLIDDESEVIAAETTAAETLAGKFRYDRFLSELNSLFVAALAGRDTPAGKELVLGGQVGYSRSLYKSETALTLAELGYDYSHEDLVAAGDGLSIHSVRGFVGHKATMTEGADLDASVEVLTNMNTLKLPTNKNGGPLRDTRVNLRCAISAQIGKNLAFQTSIEAKYDHRPSLLGVKNLAPEFKPEASRLDTIMKAAFIYTFAGTNK